MMKTLLASLILLTVSFQAHAQMTNAKKQASDRAIFVEACVTATLKGDPDRTKAAATKSCEESFAKEKPCNRTFSCP